MNLVRNFCMFLLGFEVIICVLIQFSRGKHNLIYCSILKFWFYANKAFSRSWKRTLFCWKMRYLELYGWNFDALKSRNCKIPKFSRDLSDKHGESSVISPYFTDFVIMTSLAKFWPFWLLLRQSGIINKPVISWRN